MEPRQRAFDHPPAGQEHQAFTPIGTQGHTQDAPHVLGYPLHQVPTLGPSDPAQTQLLTGPTALRQEEVRPRWVRDRGSGDDHGHAQPKRIDEEMPLAAFDLFAALVAALPA